MKRTPFFITLLVLSFLLIGTAISDATVHYVSPNGSDANVGSSDSPWATPAYGASQLQPGDRLILMAGRYVINDWDLTIRPTSGTDNAWVTVEGQPGTRPVLVGGNDLGEIIDLSGRSYVHLKNLEITHDDQATGSGMYCQSGISCIGQMGSHFILEDLYVHHLDDMGINIQDVSGMNILGCRVEFCAISGVGGPTGDSGGWQNVTIQGCSLSYNGRYYQGGDGSNRPYDRPDGMEISHGSYGPLLVEDTVAQFNYGDGLDSSAANTTIRNCIVANNSCDGVKLWRGNSRIENTLIYGRGAGNNETTPWSAIVIDTEDPGESFALVNVTVDDFVGQNYLMHVLYDHQNLPANLTIRNCIFRGIGDRTGIFVSGSAALTADHNLFFMPNWTNEILLCGDIIYTSATISTLGDGTIYGDPLFIAPAWGTTGDYRLQGGSPAINAGSSVDAPITDLNHRPRNHPFDLGAYEYES